MFSWGQCATGQLGHGGIEDVKVYQPRAVTEWPLDSETEPDVEAVSVAGGEGHSVMLSSDGKVFTCGSNDFGQLGHDHPRQKRFAQVTQLASYSIRTIASGKHHILAVDEWGKVFSWGDDSKGQLGHNLEQKSLPVPKIIRGLATVSVVQIAAGEDHCLALTSGGRLFAWGSNQFGQLGLGPNIGDKITVPQPVECLATLPVRHIACGGHHSVLVSNSGAVYAWGKNDRGQLGLGDSQNRPFPSQVRSLRTQRICYIACGGEHTVCLTEDGGVFSFGDGSYGQLGHGGKSDEQQPRKIMELMGTEVSQIACGRKHTLAFVPTRGRLYSFGLGGSGQLGNKTDAVATTPQVVLGPWISPGGAPAAPSNELSKEVVISFVGAGGDQSYACVRKSESKKQPCDYRVMKPTAKIETLTDDVIKQLTSAGADSVLDQDFLEKVETIFQSPASLNGSLLLPSHKPCTSKNEGIDVAKWTKTLDAIGKSENETIREAVTLALSNFVLPKVQAVNPPDVEALRLFITLPLFGEFSQPKLYQDIHSVYARAFISLPKAAFGVVERWISNQTKDYLLPLIENYKKVVVHILELRKASKTEGLFGMKLELALTFLRVLNRINVENHCIVSYEDFYIPEVNDHIDLPESYIRWIFARSQNRATSEFHICNYPFVFDAGAKTMLLQTDQAFQMHNASQQAATEAIAMAFLSQHSPSQVEAHGHLMCAVRRDHLVQDTLTFILMQRSLDDFKRPLRVIFDGEEGEDAGGVRREFFLFLLKEILDPKYGMFKEYEETGAIWFHPACFEDSQMFFMIGVICGLAIYNFTIINLPFPLALYKKLLSDEVGKIEDMEDLSPAVAKGLRDLLAYDGDDLENTFCLNFTVTEDVFGEPTVKELKPGGENIAVTKENRQSYVDLYCDYVLNKSVDHLYQQFHEGFHKVCGGRVLDLFHARELMAMVVGTENYDWEEFEKQADYKNGYDKDHPTIKMFWEVFHELSGEDKKKFLMFLTGTDRIPVLGMTAKKLTIQKTGDSGYLPVAHTCFNLLDLPEYSTKERLRYKLLQAIHGTQGFGLV